MRLRFLLLCLLFIMGGFLQQVLAQQIAVSGKVTNKTTGEALAGASVIVQGTTMATQTNAQGQFTINVAKGAVVVVSFEGFESVKNTINGPVTLGIALELSTANTLNDVIVIGYGTRKITKVSGAISTVKSEDIEKLKPVRTEEALQGRASGVNVIQNGTPGSKPTVLVRGIPSFSGTDPMVIIDGVPQTLTDFNSINAADIESINVLKDAAATAIYGVKGGNGVIVVTTKSGRKNQKTDITINGNYGVQNVINTIGVLNASEYAAMINEGSTVAGGPVVFSDLSKVGVGTNWQNQVFKNASFQTHSIAARGGSDKMTYFLSGGYVDQGGIVGGDSKSRFSRGNFTANLNFDLSSKVKLLINTTAVTLSGRGVQENSFNSIIGSAINFDPTVSVLNTVPNTVGQYGFSTLLLSEIYNPLTKLENTYNKNTGSKIYGKFELQYDIMKDLKLTTRFGYTKYDGNAKGFNPLVFYGPQNVDNSMNADGSTVAGRFNSVSHEKTSNFNWTWETYANYNFKIKNDHQFETVVGMAVAKTSGNAAGASRQDVPFNSWDFADFTAATGNNNATNSNAINGYYYQYFRRNLSYFGRVNYDYQDKYLGSLTLRRDGSYAFGSENRFANFLSGSAGWVISNESFFKSKVVDYLKIRGSYGSIGNENVNPQYVSIVTGGPSYGPTANSNGYNFGDVFYPGSTVASAANNALRWEKQLQANFGFDAAFLSRKLNLSVDYFQKNVDGLLFTPSASMYLGTVPIPTANIGSTSTRGLDLSISYNDIFGKDLKFNTSLTFTTAKNEVTATNDDGTAKILGGFYFNGQSQSVTVFEKGATPGYFFGYKTVGLFQNAADIAKAPTQAGAVPGDIQFADINGDGVINANDRTKIGDPFPTFTMGWNLSLDYKNFDFNMFTYASIGNDIYKAYERNANFSNKSREVLARWTGEGSTNDARYPRYSFTDANSNIRVSDRYVEDGSFVKIKNIQLGYTFTSPTIKKAFSKLRVYVQVRNAFTFTKYTGFDPEIAGGILDTGIDRGAYPQARTFSVGLDIKL
ncbi:MAG: SusC/RagA family TonB-linked outer membrane protein [Sphingobacteriia bacterium 24-36-13]|uniref:SusC/RagA family TonB-linked outer membrane protein n=1 Tax=Sediminibacterium sp. TaxID=1917865 RepID=UPI000BD94802|nr:TonB-dependent receptor [Sediminibacterium sp.]OYY10892.1 MAG: SusC/RagA family TonB-linked outer membrane protein [Sphingobacteriia bacterium 35-36-14]OYZ53450.1 MAG: SusC/RagA family TonB-linked outer membrane protein [Sphingobacteriia bacterium 24-36-13]OZA65895.1 MAG: SusC/RagA family TonB-linked outer membrane protein [Sphingobacteriia bacterium 39-36-14]HQS24634.1 TonB-dependent receptor [Sediminibacterium sp.]HQS34218.1 TonB-dependent receptor [Sediminibacterium sp.]